MSKLMKKCPCGSGTPFTQCCDLYLRGKSSPSTAEALMRSRYTAYALRDIEYLVKTTHPRQAKKDLAESIRSWAEQTIWLELKILNTHQGGEADKVGKVEFQAEYELNGSRQTHHELSRFKRYNENWYFFAGETI